MRILTIVVAAVLLFFILLATTPSFVCHLEDKLSARFDSEVTLWCSR